MLVVAVRGLVRFLPFPTQPGHFSRHPVGTRSRSFPRAFPFSGSRAGPCFVCWTVRRGQGRTVEQSDTHTNTHTHTQIRRNTHTYTNALTNSRRKAPEKEAGKSRLFQFFFCVFASGWTSSRELLACRFFFVFERSNFNLPKTAWFIHFATPYATELRNFKFRDFYNKW
jgi:hypothetical protein